MFIKINNCNYYIQNAKKKSPTEIFEEIFKRSSLQYITKDKKKEYIKLIYEQLYS